MLNFKLINKLVISFLAVALLTCNFAYAKRLGGGASMGRQSSSVTKNQNSLPPKPTAAPVGEKPTSTVNPTSAPAAPTAPVRQPSRFGGLGGILGGVAAGIGLSYLFSHMGMGGMGEGLASMFSGILMLALVGILIMFLIRKFGPKSNSMFASAPAGSFNRANVEPNFSSNWNSPNQRVNQEPILNNTASQPYLVNGNSSQLDAAPTHLSEKDSFLQNAKSLFIQLQEASDQQNLDKLREYTTPDMFNLLRQDMLNRSSALSFTQVLTLAADLVALEEDGKEFLASTRFSGSLREEKDGPVTEFEEVWNWVKPAEGNTGWLLCGIQQIH
ncbi:Tim44 domain-containing protein [Polynucleobacter kasalickyi]|uniref:Predicted lipid-binding transport protein, Tim44 family n=1 Tax=Polynucleobacter kasalickyi TaxID=1938817 RepID=A0A1W2A3J0_9BURK|nr:TIM44-like domain-containing protein [Polynucleobacter kasalickyi]SMC55257.1 Predicted lipid-binding transport protein, Tim44 family [Polynucleobacter kasalickyi]